MPLLHCWALGNGNAKTCYVVVSCFCFVAFLMHSDIEQTTKCFLEIITSLLATQKFAKKLICSWIERIVFDDSRTRIGKSFSMLISDKNISRCENRLGSMASLSVVK